MEVVNKKLVLLVIMLGIFCTFFIWQNISDKETKLEMVSLNNETKSSSMLAIMLEQEDGTYKEIEENIWPTSSIYKYDDTRSGCMDANGNKIENALEYDEDNNIASVKTEKSSYCYLYFSISKICETGTQIGECLLENPTLALNTSMEGGLYRYQGSVADNYICFGTNDIDECLNNTDKYLYRIIGINENNELKLIKNTSIGNIQWHSDSTMDTTWPNSDLFKGLNGIEQENITPIFIDNITYDYMETDNGWYNKIANVDWKYGDTTSIGNYDGDTIYAVESAWGAGTSTNEGKEVAKIGLMYIHDYYYAYGVGGSPGTYTEAKTAWIFLEETIEWTMSRYGLSIGNYIAWSILGNGVISNNNLTNTFTIRPVFYLTSDLQYILGLGTKNYPFIVE